jgi:hypothetical protein
MRERLFNPHNWKGLINELIKCPAGMISEWIDTLEFLAGKTPLIFWILEDISISNIIHFNPQTIKHNFLKVNPKFINQTLGALKLL